MIGDVFICIYVKLVRSHANSCHSWNKCPKCPETGEAERWVDLKCTWKLLIEDPISFFYYAYLIILELFIKSITSRAIFNGTFVCKVSTYTWVCFWALSLVLWSICLFPHQYYLNYYGFIRSINIWQSKLSNLLLLQARLGLLFFLYINSRTSLSSSSGQWGGGILLGFFVLVVLSI